MKNEISQGAKELSKARKFRKGWQKIATALAAVAVFCTTYALILPAITMEKDAVCGLEAHEHGESCYTEQVSIMLQCSPEIPEGYSISHSHEEICYDPNGDLTCTLAQTEEHVHSDDCFTAVEVSCELEETEGHTHGDACYLAGTQLVCTLEESEGHAHSDACTGVQSELICAKAETAAHQHDESCTVTETTRILTCGLPEHIHEDACYPLEEESSQYLCAAGEHVHSDSCFGEAGNLVCTIPEHTHSAECVVADYDEYADVESPADWNAAVANTGLTGDWALDVLAIAESQMGYQESARNVILTENGDLKGYSRYGAWYGVPYEDWCAMFVSFCLDYAGVDTEVFPQEADNNSWIEKLTGLDLYFTPDVYTPLSGDLIFFDRNDDGLSDHMGLVAELIPATEGTPAQIKTIEGDAGDQVRYMTCDMDDPTIMGYGALPDAPNVYTYEDAAVQVRVVLPGDTAIPGDAVLAVTPIVEEDEVYADLLSRAEDSVEGTITNVMFYDLSFYTQDKTYLPVEDTAKVTMKFAESPVNPESDVTVLHFHESEATVIDVEETAQQTDVSVLEDVTVEEQTTVSILQEDTTNTVVTFNTDGFSVFALVECENGLSDALANGEYYTQVVSDVTQLDGKTLVISNPYHGKVLTHTQNRNSQMTSADYSAAGTVSDNTYSYVTLPQDTYDNAAWTFEKVAGYDSRYYIYYTSNNTKRYLTIGNNNSLTVTTSRSAVDVVDSQNGNIVYLRSTSNVNYYVDYYTNSQVFASYSHTTDVTTNTNIRLILSAYDSNYTVDDAQYTITNLGGQSVAIVSVQNLNIGTSAQYSFMTGTPVDSSLSGKLLEGTVSTRKDSTDSTEENWVMNISNVTSADLPLWTFHDTAEPGIYYICFGNSYLNITENGLAVTDTPQGIEALSAARTNDDGETWEKVEAEILVLRADIDGDFYYITLDSEGNFSSSKFEDVDIEYDEVSGRATYSSHLMLVNGGITEVENLTTLNATVKIFNYDATVNQQNNLLVNNNYKFFNSNSPSVDGLYSGTHDLYRYSNMKTVLSDAGYPAMTVGNQEGDMEYLFGNTDYLKGIMTDGGGLFQQDADGYYYYYSDNNAAYYDANQNKFILYDTVIRPSYTGTTASDAQTRNDQMSNFLPFNNPIGNSVVDGEDGGVTSSVTGETVQSAKLTEPTDLWFGMSVEFDFFMPQDGLIEGKEMIFQFHGDDDVFVYVDGVLILNIGGAHAALDGYINFATGYVEYEYVTGDNGTVYTCKTTIRECFQNAYNNGGIDQATYDAAMKEMVDVDDDGDLDTFADYTIHTLNFFYMERGGNISYCGLKFNMPTLPVNSLTVTKQMLDGAAEDTKEDFTFRVVKANSSGQATESLFVQPGTIFHIWESGVDTGRTGVVANDGTFTIKAGESAMFTDILGDTSESPPDIIVQEILDSGLAYNVYYAFSSNRTLVRVEEETGTEYYIYNSGSYSSAGNSEMITYYNSPAQSGILSITKAMAEGSVAASGERFDVQIKLGGILIPVGTKYHVYGVSGIEDGTIEEVKTEGIISLYPGETVSIIGIRPGLTYEVTEVLRDGQLYEASYSVTWNERTGSAAAQGTESTAVESTGTVTASGVTGVIGTNSIVTVTATNQMVVGVQVPISKLVMDSTESDTFTFDIVQVDSNYEPVTPANSSQVTITVTEKTGTANADGSTRALLRFENPIAGTYYFKISEVANSGAGVYTYDADYYIVQVQVTGSGSDVSATVTGILDNGIVEVDISDGIPTLSFVNYAPSGYELPSTGGMGGSLYITGGATLLIVALAILMYIQKRRKEVRTSS